MILRTKQEIAILYLRLNTIKRCAYYTKDLFERRSAMVRINQEVTQIPESGYLVTYEQLNTLITFLKLWSQLGMWTRSLMVSIVGNLENKTAVVNQLFSIPTEFYNTFRIFYGPVISQQLLNLLTNFITNEWSLIDALNSGDQERADDSTISLYQSADELASLLSKLNIYWDEDQWKSLLYQYIKLLIDEMVAMLAGDHEREIEIYNRMDDVTDLLGSYMARGIAGGMGISS